MKTITDKFIDFIITQKCTYKCAYCSQSKCQQKIKYEANNETIHAFYRLLDKIDKDYEITITGGEAILHPNFYEIIEQVKLRGFKINLITNLSFKIEEYQKIFKLLDESLNKFDISVHVDEIQSFNSMLEKLELFLLTKPKTTKTTIFIPLYNVDAKKESKIDKVIRLAKKQNIEYSFQKIRFLTKYKNEHNEKYRSTHTKQKTFGRLCHAGFKSAVIYENGDVYRCYSSRFLKTNYLGNLSDRDFALNSIPSACNSCVCTCPKPRNYFQILDEKDEVVAFKNLFLNIAYLPQLMLKNKEIVFRKLKQFLKISN